MESGCGQAALEIQELAFRRPPGAGPRGADRGRWPRRLRRGRAVTMADWGALALAAGFGYLLGSIPFGLLLTKFAGLGDIRAIGSGNIGATNVMRTGRKSLALATLVLDFLKAFIP